MPSMRVLQSIRVAASPEAVWRAITSPEELGRWYAPGCTWEIRALQPGATIHFHNTPTEILEATIVEAVPPRRLTLAWTVDPERPEVRLLNSFELRAGDGGTDVDIAQEGYEALPAEERESWIRQDEDAFAAIAAALKEHVEQDAGPV